MNASIDQSRKNRRTTLLLAGLVLGMFGFGFAMVPLYGFLCKITGTQSVEVRGDVGKTPVAGEAALTVDPERRITVKFDTNVHPELPWSFRVTDGRMEVQPGQMYEVMFEVTNRSSRDVVGQAIASVAPWQASGFFTKLECFCFQRQELGAGETREMPLRFQVMPQLPGDINSLTLSYIFMNTHEATASTDSAGKKG
jgi:cytochrome c oxidase assembly protein subunit 11